jgi:hypothetical protein
MFKTKDVGKFNYTFYGQYFSSEKRAVYEIMRKNMVEPDRTQMTI